MLVGRRNEYSSDSSSALLEFLKDIGNISGLLKHLEGNVVPRWVNLRFAVHPWYSSLVSLSSCPEGEF